MTMTNDELYQRLQSLVLGTVKQYLDIQLSSLVVLVSKEVTQAVSTITNTEPNYDWEDELIP